MIRNTLPTAELWLSLTQKLDTTAIHTASPPKHSTSSHNANLKVVQNVAQSLSKPSYTSLTPTRATAWTHPWPQPSRPAQSTREKSSQTEEQEPCHILKLDTIATHMAHSVRNTRQRTTQHRYNSKCQTPSSRLELGAHRSSMCKTRNEYQDWLKMPSKSFDSAALISKERDGQLYGKLAKYLFKKLMITNVKLHF